MTSLQQGSVRLLVNDRNLTGEGRCRKELKLCLIVWGSGGSNFPIHFVKGCMGVRDPAEFPEKKNCGSFIERLVVIAAFGGIYAGGTPVFAPAIFY